MKYTIPLFIALIGFGLSALLFIVTIFNAMLIVRLETWSFLLFVLMSVPFGWMIFSEHDSFDSVEKKKQAQEKFRQALPRWAKYVGAFLFVCVLGNMVSSVVLDGSRLPKRDKERYFLYDKNSHQEIPLTLPEYAVYKSRETRILASFALLFYFVPACYFGLHKSKDEQENNSLR